MISPKKTITPKILKEAHEQLKAASISSLYYTNIFGRVDYLTSEGIEDLYEPYKSMLAIRRTTKGGVALDLGKARRFCSFYGFSLKHTTWDEFWPVLCNEDRLEEWVDEGMVEWSEMRMREVVEPKKLKGAIAQPTPDSTDYIRGSHRPVKLNHKICDAK